MKGGRRENSGRPENFPEDQIISLSIRMPEEMRQVYRELGGVKWLRETLWYAGKAAGHKWRIENPNPRRRS